MDEELINEIESDLEVFARDPEKLFDLADRWEEEDGVLTVEDMQLLTVCLNFTAGALAGYLQIEDE